MKSDPLKGGSFYFVFTQRNPVWLSPVSGLVFIRAPGRYPVQNRSLQSQEPPRVTRLGIPGSPGSKESVGPRGFSTRTEVRE